MTQEEWLAQAHKETVVDIGQLEPRTKHALDREAKAGRLIKWREPWLGCIGSPRSHWGPS